ncbi:hypothetical protein Pcinc_019120 [Petrolisthes cinctipes]|uniref:Uncharacterized protein n=1 Tax=Petrolisthes cinctipes TaxID=88211 RepID=A0AAE1FMC6_PETCI|nr:hypothetical protein Pcinc_019120 [Petrolisthes cinctipes]
MAAAAVKRDEMKGREGVTMTASQLTPNPPHLDTLPPSPLSLIPQLESWSPTTTTTILLSHILPSSFLFLPTPPQVVDTARVQHMFNKESHGHQIKTTY